MKVEAKRRGGCASTPFRFVTQAASLAQKRCAASPTAVVSDPAGSGFAGWKHLTLHFLRVHMSASDAEIVDWASEIDRVRGLVVGPLRVPGTLDAVASGRTECGRARWTSVRVQRRSFERVPTRIWRQLLDRSAARCDPGDSAHWPHDTRVGRQVALRNTDKIESLAGDNGYDDQSLRDAPRSDGVRPVIKHRLFAHYDHAHNARLDSDLYGQRWLAESAFSAIKRRYGSAVRPGVWYRAFRELVLTAAVYNLEQAIKE
nr:transposase [Halomicrobium urmianum]